MQALQNDDLLSSDTRAMDQLHAFLRQRRSAPAPVSSGVGIVRPPALQSRCRQCGQGYCVCAPPEPPQTFTRALGACPRNILWQINDLYVFQEIRKIPIPSKYAGFLKMAESEITFSRL